MLKKIFKTILVLSLCLGLTLPTNAAVSVSDGSAFVTKAEFAADLNNLSNRMAQLENSLDAKIDSLVSSYLTRNGIWNGAKQSIMGYSATFNSNNKGFATSVTGSKTLETEILSSRFLSSKAGMLFLIFQLKLNKPTTVGGWRPTISIIGSSNLKYRTSRSINLRLYNANGDLIYYNDIINQLLCDDNTRGMLCFPELGKWVVQAFVEKDYISLAVNDTWFSAVSGDKYTSEVFYIYLENASMELSVTDAYVY